MDNNNKISKSTFWSNLFKTPARKSDLEEVLSSMPTFKHLNSTQLKYLLEIAHNRVYSAGEYIFYQGDPGIALYLITDGEIRIMKHNDNSDEIELAHFNRGDFFGELALLDDDVRSASAIAVKESKITVIFRPDLDKFIDRFPKVGIKILKGLAQIIATRLRLLDEEFLALYSKTQNNSDEVKNE
ncbi:MAG: cyclic nucleotide-binding domain-containing protein [Melioribacteraceae bacterium]|nr:cyclic nucleotide-binding domain-containing protein [Melioribacteraceae bacterium]